MKNDNAFQYHELTEYEEKVEGFQLSATSLKILDNYIADIAHNIINLSAVPEQESQYFRALSFAQGQIKALKYFRDLAVFKQNGSVGDEPVLQMPDELA